MAIMVAATHPERSTALVLFAPTLAPPAGFRRESLRHVEGKADTGVDEWFGFPIAQHIAPSHADDKDFARWWRRYAPAAMSPGDLIAMMQASNEAALGADAAVAAVHVPTLVVTRSDNRVVPPSQSREVAALISGARFVELAGEDYAIHAGDVDAVVDEVQEFITGARAVREPDRALATVLFTDIVASTEHATRLGDKKWTDVLNQHDALVSRELERHRGRKVNPTGDGILATFDGPARAVRCAQAICDGMQALGIDVRAGLHTGEVELRGDDIGGIAVHIGQRVSALAGPGEVLVSRTVTDLVAGSGLEFEERSEHELKGVPGKWAIYAVRS
jgi:class 3 adenylate cyclase